MLNGMCNYFHWVTYCIVSNCHKAVVTCCKYANKDIKVNRNHPIKPREMIVLDKPCGVFNKMCETSLNRLYVKAESGGVFRNNTGVVL